MSKYIVIIDNYAGAGYLPDDEPAEFDNLEDAEAAAIALRKRVMPWSTK